MEKRRPCILIGLEKRPCAQKDKERNRGVSAMFINWQTRPKGSTDWKSIKNTCLTKDGRTKALTVFLTYAEKPAVSSSQKGCKTDLTWE